MDFIFPHMYNVTWEPSKERNASLGTLIPWPKLKLIPKHFQSLQRDSLVNYIFKVIIYMHIPGFHQMQSISTDWMATIP